MPSANSVVPDDNSVLVNKIVTSSTPATQLKTDQNRRRLKNCKKRVRTSYFEHNRIARSAGLYAVALTPTFANPATFSSKDLSNFIARVRSWLRRRGHKTPYTWVLERAGTLHYHLQIWLPRGLCFEKAALEKWWPHGSIWVESCDSPRAWAEYMCKKGGKDAAQLPKHARLYGSGGFDELGRVHIERARLPKWLRDMTSVEQMLIRSPGQGWLDLDSGQIYESPWFWQGGRFHYRPNHALPSN